MVDVMRHRYDDPALVSVPVDSAQVVEIGDLVYRATDDIRAADQISADTLINMQDAFVDDFVGVAMSASASGETEPVRVATTGTFEFICAAATFVFGDIVGVAGTDAVALDNQTVIAVSAAVSGIGKVKQTYANNTTRVLVQINSTLFTGGLQPSTAST